MHLNVHSSTIFNSQDMEATKMPLNRQVDEEDGAYSYTHTHMCVYIYIYIYIYIYTMEFFLCVCCHVQLFVTL